MKSKNPSKNVTKNPHVRKRPVAKAKAKRRISLTRSEKSRVWIGIDLSLNSLAMAALAYDDVLKKHQGPVFHSVDWHSDDHYFDRLYQLSVIQNHISPMLYEMKIFIDLPQIYIAQEEPWPLGIVGKGNSQTLKQQAEMSGALLAGLLRYGYRNIYQINAAWWKKLVADDLGITTHYSKWGKGIVGKMRCKQWALSHQGYGFMHLFPNEVPVWPDLISDSKNGGRKPKPKNSKATPLQPDDRYQALPIALWMMENEEQS